MENKMKEQKVVCFLFCFLLVQYKNAIPNLDETIAVSGTDHACLFFIRRLRSNQNGCGTRKTCSAAIMMDHWYLVIHQFHESAGNGKRHLDGLRAGGHLDRGGAPLITTAATTLQCLLVCSSRKTRSHWSMFRRWMSRAILTDCGSSALAAIRSRWCAASMITTATTLLLMLFRIPPVGKKYVYSHTE